MPCNCGGGSVTSPLMSSAATQTGGVVVPDPYEYEVTYPTGRKKTFDSEAEAYRAIRLTGGGVRRKTKT